MTTDSNEKGYIWDEAIGNAFEDAGVDARLLDAITREQWSDIAKSLNEHAETAPDFFAPTPSSAEIRSWEENPIIANLKAERDRLEAEIRVFADDIKRNFGGQTVYADLSSQRVVILDR